MADTTGISWCDSTFNPWIGCTRVSPACDDCYAARSTPARALGVVWGSGEPRRRTSDANWELPRRWNAQEFVQCAACGWRGEHRKFQRQDVGMISSACPACEHDAYMLTRRRVFCASLADVFDNEVPVQWRADLLQLIDLTPNLDWLLLTKRIGNVEPMLKDIRRAMGGTVAFDLWPRPNVWLGITVINQAEADRDIQKLLAVPARVRFLSIEPALEAIDLQRACTARCPNGDCFPHGSGHRVVVDSENGGTLVECICSRLNGLDWVIAGGESGPQARPSHPDWYRSLRDQCAAAGVPFLFKQWGEYAPAAEGFARNGDVFQGDGLWSVRVGKKAAGRLLDGIEHQAFPTSVSES